jgi:hypothetical protein
MFTEEELHLKWLFGVANMKERNAEKRERTNLEVMWKREAREKSRLENIARREKWEAEKPMRAEYKEQQKKLKAEIRAKYAENMARIEAEEKRVREPNTISLDDVITQLLKT